MIPVVFADQEALDAWDEAQRRVDALVDADADEQRSALDFIRDDDR